MPKRKSKGTSFGSRKGHGFNLQTMLKKENAKLQHKIAALEATVISLNNRIKALEKQLSYGAPPKIDAELDRSARDLLKRIRK